MLNEDIAEVFNASGPEYESSATELINLCASMLVERLQVDAGQDLVDLGCGAGISIAHAESRLSGGSALGIDLSRVQLELARERFRRSPLQPRFIQEDAGATSLADRSADAVSLGLVLPYSERPQQLVKEATRLARLGGRVAATVIGAPFFGVPGTRLLGLLERRGVAWPEIELQFESEGSGPAGAALRGRRPAPRRCHDRRDRARILVGQLRRMVANVARVRLPAPRS